MPQSTQAYVALLRGLNVGGKGMISMSDLRAAFESLGLADVRTYINSGNVVFRHKAANSRKLEAKAESAVPIPTKVVIRTLPEYESIVEAIPKSWSDDEVTRVYVLFLRHTVDSRDALAKIEVNTEVEQLIYTPGALLWAADRSGLTRSRVAKMPKAIAQEMTARNLNTTRKLYDLLKS
jgi:uncharacterized protein (DUF1697 family)